MSINLRGSRINAAVLIFTFFGCIFAYCIELVHILVTEYLKWKESISSAVIHSPKVTRRPVLTWSSTEEGPATSQRHKSKYDSVERDEVFQKIEETATSNPGRPNTPLNPSPRVSNQAYFVQLQARY